LDCKPKERKITLNLDFNAVTAIATVLAVLVAIYALWVEQRRSRFRHGIDLLLRMSDLFFYNKNFINNRRKAIEHLKKNLVLREGSIKRKKNVNSEKLGTVELDAILDFFEGLGIMVYEKSLDKELTYNYFSWWLECYYTLAEDYINHWRELDSNYWYDVELLHQTFMKIKKRGETSDTIKLSLDDLKAFIEDEMSLK